MTKTALKKVDAALKKRWSEISRLRQALEDMQDHLAILQCRTHDDGRRYSPAQACQKLKIKL
ncbi:MAG: hypothetical protein HY360_19855 [Verrucomicrobia bacterium]|nr:hypothetical protein [Verrucomicrobiota bacterium]